jgi:aryl-alcohol dehydrogenase-like predicted oxidoreductase
MQAIADLRGWSPLVALEIEYSLIERTVERDLIPMASEMALGVIPWSPLGRGVLTGKYTSRDLEDGGDSAGSVGTRNSAGELNGSLSERSLAIAEVVTSVATELGRTPAQVALAWVLLNDSVTAPLIGARTLSQLEDNLGALEVDLPDDACARLEQASAVALGFPHDVLARPSTMASVFGDTKVSPRRPRAHAAR